MRGYFAAVPQILQATETVFHRFVIYRLLFIHIAIHPWSNNILYIDTALTNHESHNYQVVSSFVWYLFLYTESN